MVNPVTSKSHFEKLIFGQCCFFFTLKSGTLIIGITQLICGILWLIGGVTSGSSGFSGLISTVFMIASGVLTILALRKEEVKYLWYAVYLNISIGVWLLIFTIIMLISLNWGLAIGAIINGIVMFYFASILRSYAFEIEAAATTTTPIPA